MARGLLMPFHVQTKTTAYPFMFPSFFSWASNRPQLGQVYRAKRVRFCCSGEHQIDMSVYKEKFAKRMDLAGIKPHHKIAIAVSGGPDSMALCVLTAGWKTDNCDAANKVRNEPIDGLLAIVVDHGLRIESAEEANLVYNRMIDMRIKCEVARCEWVDGKPKLGHVQEEARNKRYEILQRLCIQQQIGILLIAHHGDDQAELFILRLSRNSGVLGLAGMAFTSQMFPKFNDFIGESSKAHSIVVVRPLLDFFKEDMYSICRGGNQEWVEDPTNRSPLYARNRIRMSLNDLSESTFKAELLAVVSVCRRTRSHVDKLCRLLMDQALTIMPHGYAVIDLEKLRSIEMRDIYLAKFVTLVLQFVSQRHKPLRGNGLKLLLDYLHTFPCKTSLTVAGCYLCPAPGSKGTKVLVCCSINLSSPAKLELLQKHSNGVHKYDTTSEIDQILTYGEASLDKFIPDFSTVPFLEATSSDSVLTEAKKLGILSDSTYETIVSLQKEENKNFKSKPKIVSDYEIKGDDAKTAFESPSRSISPGQSGYFMSRFILSCNVQDRISDNSCSCCLVDDDVASEVRLMVDSDWLYLSELSKMRDVAEGKTRACLDYAKLSADRALVSLKSIPVAARRAIPVIVNTQGVLLSIPSVGFSHCPRLVASAEFNPRIPLGGGRNSFL